MMAKRTVRTIAHVFTLVPGRFLQVDQGGNMVSKRSHTSLACERVCGPQDQRRRQASDRWVPEAAVLLSEGGQKFTQLSCKPEG